MKYLFATLILTASANACVFLPAPLEARVAGALLFVFVLPGSAFVSLLFSRRTRMALAERCVLSAGASVALSVLLFWGIFLTRVPISVFTLAFVSSAFTLILAFMAAWRDQRAPVAARTPGRVDRPFLAVFAVLVVAGAFLLLARLDHGEYLFDEYWIVSSATDLLFGKAAALFALPKGPAQIILAAWFMRLTDSYYEGVLRLPAALCALISVAGFVLFARSRLRPAAVLIAGLLLLSLGMWTGLVRWLQFQGFVLAMGQLGLLCALRAYQRRRQPEARSYWVLCAVLLGAALLGHYFAAFFVPAIGYLFVKAHHRTLRCRSTWLGGLALASFALAVSVPYYVMLLALPVNAREMQEGYLDQRLDLSHAPFNHLNDFFWEQWDYNSALQQAIVLAALAVALFSVYGRMRLRSGTPRVAASLYLACVLLTGLAVVQPDALSVAGTNVSLVPFACFGLFLLWKGVPDAFWGSVALVAFVTFGFTGFFMASPNDHYLAGLPPLLLGAVEGMRLVARGAQARWSAANTRAVRIVVAVLVGVWLVALVSYDALQNIAYLPRKLDAQASDTPALFGQLASPRLISSSFFLVNRGGWRAIAVMYETGAMRGEHNSTDPRIMDFYLNHQWTPATPRPVFFIVAPPEKPGRDRKPVPADLLTTHRLWATITVDGVAQTRIYRLRDGLPDDPRLIAAEGYDATWRSLATLSRLEVYRARQRDDTAFYAISKTLLAEGRVGDAVVFSNPEARRVLDEYYPGTLPYVDPVTQPLPSSVSRVWGVFWGQAASVSEDRLAHIAYPLSARWMANVRLRPFMLSPDVPFAEIRARADDLAMLTGVAPLPETVLPGSWIPVHLRWQVDSPTDRRYKVFIHVADSGGQPVAQADDEPVAGLRPTDTWRAGELIDDRYAIMLPPELRPGSYVVLAGLYDPATSARIPAFRADGSQFPNDAFVLGTVKVTTR
ncbi:MAG: DUF1616 domain-containing protein [Chloroflexi bacterium]|nr:DUF1616 domain-containing protein [Chloroflexota bacterium]